MTIARINVWPMALAAAAILLITTGARQSLGLFMAPIHASTGIGIVALSFALAVGQFTWGAAQAAFGAAADRYGPGKVLVWGALLLAVGSALAAHSTSQWGLMVTLGILSAAGAGAGSYSVLIGATARRTPVSHRTLAAGVINGGGSLGQFVFAPLSQFMIATFGWVAGLYTLAVAGLATLPLIRPLLRAEVIATPPTAAGAAAIAPHAVEGGTLGDHVRAALKDRSYLCLHIAFFTCGFHIAFLVTHLPGEVNLCGLPASVAATSLAIIGLSNVVGSVTIGWLGDRYRMKWLLVWTYLARVLAIGVYISMPRTPTTFYVFAAALGLTWLSTVPPTAGLVGKLFGVRYLATLFGLTLLTHQIGGFFGAWLGGLALVRFGDFTWMWYADMALALGAALVHLPIREQPVMRAQFA